MTSPEPITGKENKILIPGLDSKFYFLEVGMGSTFLEAQDCMEDGWVTSYIGVLLEEEGGKWTLDRPAIGCSFL